MKYSIIVITIGIITSIILAVFLFLPEYQKLDDLQDQLLEKRIELENQNKYTSQLLATERNFEENQELVNKINSALPIGPDIPSLLNFLQEVSLETGMSLEGVSWQKLPSSREEKKGPLEEYSLNLELSGSYFAFKNFLFSLEKSSRLINVIESKFSVPEEENESIFFNIVLKVYSY